MEFDDSLFEEFYSEKDRRKIVQQHQYTPKICDPEWFMESLTVSDEDYMIDKFKADLLYYKGQYELALKIYKNVLSILPHTHGQVKREVQDSIVRCLLKCNGKEETVQWAWPLIQPPHEKDASSWQLLANCYCHTGNVFEETIARQQCALLQRHYPLYWKELSHTYQKVKDAWTRTEDQEINKFKILQNTVTLFKPYIRLSGTATQGRVLSYELFISLIVTSESNFSKTVRDISFKIHDVLTTVSCAALIWSKQLLSFSLSRSSSFAAISQSDQLEMVTSILSDCYHDDIVTYLSQHMTKASALDL